MILVMSTYFYPNHGSSEGIVGTQTSALQGQESKHAQD